ncbi:MAG: ribonuclease P protein component [Alphaproteobacteria bacterium]|nr:ribonuclease P protein component [Alphaproteobacteria bacterium]
MKRSDFLGIAAEKRKWAAPGLVLQARACPSGPDHRIRVGFTASRRVGGAVRRNRAKRRLRAVAADILPAYAATGTDYVLIARTATSTRGYEKLLTDLRQALDKVEALREPPGPK